MSMSQTPTLDDYINAGPHVISEDHLSWIRCQGKVTKNVLTSYYKFKSTITKSIYESIPIEEFFITCKCGFDCNCYSHQAKPRLQLHMCLSKEKLEWFCSRQTFQFKIEWQCDICQTALNCCQILNYTPHIMSRSQSRSHSPAHINSEDTQFVLPPESYQTIYVTVEMFMNQG